MILLSIRDPLIDVSLEFILFSVGLTSYLYGKEKNRQTLIGHQKKYIPELNLVFVFGALVGFIVTIGWFSPYIEEAVAIEYCGIKENKQGVLFEYYLEGELNEYCQEIDTNKENIILGEKYIVKINWLTHLCYVDTEKNDL